MNVATPRFQNFSLDANLIVGHDENFYEWASGDHRDRHAGPDLAAHGAAADQPALQPPAVHPPATTAAPWRVRRVPRLKAEYQLTRPIFVRFVGQYDAERTDALRDDSRTGGADRGARPRDRGVSPAPRRARATRSGWTGCSPTGPTPGTVVFAGYGSRLEDAEAFRFRALRRVSDGFFVKLSYLFRV